MRHQICHAEHITKPFHKEAKLHGFHGLHPPAGSSCSSSSSSSSSIWGRRGYYALISKRGCSSITASLFPSSLSGFPQNVVCSSKGDRSTVVGSFFRRWTRANRQIFRFNQQVSKGSTRPATVPPPCRHPSPLPVPLLLLLLLLHLRRFEEIRRHVLARTGKPAPPSPPREGPRGTACKKKTQKTKNGKRTTKQTR